MPTDPTETVIEAVRDLVKAELHRLNAELPDTAPFGGWYSAAVEHVAAHVLSVNPYALDAALRADWPPYIGVTVSVTAAELDGAPIVQIDTDESVEGLHADHGGEPQIRVYINDWCTFEGKPYDPDPDDADD